MLFFEFPLYLWLLPLAAIPLVIAWFHRPVPPIVPFGAMRILQTVAAPYLRRQRQLQWWRLFARIGVLTALLLAMAAPMWSATPPNRFVSLLLPSASRDNPSWPEPVKSRYVGDTVISHLTPIAEKMSIPITTAPKPDDTTLVWMVAGIPDGEMTPELRQSLHDFLRRGGNVILILGPQSTAESGVSELHLAPEDGRVHFSETGLDTGKNDGNENDLPQNRKWTSDVPLSMSLKRSLKQSLGNLREPDGTIPIPVRYYVPLHQQSIAKILRQIPSDSSDVSDSQTVPYRQETLLMFSNGDPFVAVFSPDHRISAATPRGNSVFGRNVGLDFGWNVGQNFGNVIAVTSAPLMSFGATPHWDGFVPLWTTIIQQTIHDAVVRKTATGHTPLSPYLYVLAIMLWFGCTRQT